MSLKTILLLFPVLCLSFRCMALHKVFLKRECIADQPYVIWHVEPEDTGICTLASGGWHQWDGMEPMHFELPQCYLDCRKASDGHYQVWINDTLSQDLFVYRHTPIGRCINFMHSGGGYFPDTAYSYFIQEYADGNLIVEYNRDGSLRYRGWGTKALPITPADELYSPYHKVEQFRICTERAVCATAQFYPRSDRISWNIDTQIGCPVAHLRHPVCEQGHIDSFKVLRRLNGQFTWLLKDPVTEEGIGTYKYTGTALVVTFKSNNVVEWKLSKLSNGKRTTISNFSAAGKTIWPREKAQGYLEEVILKGR